MEGIARTRIAAWGTALALVTGGVIGATTAATSPAGQGEAMKSAADATRAQVPQPRASATGSSQVMARAAARRAGRVTARWRGAINTSSRAAVNAGYWNRYASGLSVPTGYTGSDASCARGTVTAQSRAATLRAINYVRSLSGLYPVRLSSALNTRSQYTALMMSANKTLSHYPTSRWRCYSRTGAANAARSNLALGYPRITSAGVVGMYMKDAGAGNHAVGHRRWLLNPFTTVVGSGATETANAITVIGPRNNYRPNPAYVAWPPAGYFPNAIEPNGRWSLSTGNNRMSFSGAKVRVHRNGVPIRAVKLAVRNGYAMPTIAWQMPPRFSKAGRYRVVVSGIRLQGTKRKFTRRYSVVMFTPSR